MEANEQQQTCVRVCPQRFVQPQFDDHEEYVVKTISLPTTHSAVRSKEIIIFGPLTPQEGGFPLRVFTIGPGAREGHNPHVDEDLPNLDAFKTFSAYNAEGFTHHQFEVLWFWHKFAKGEHVPGLEVGSADLELAKAVWGPQPTHQFNEATHRDAYSGWTKAHFEQFSQVYIAKKPEEEQGLYEMPRGLSRFELETFEKDLARGDLQTTDVTGTVSSEKTEGLKLGGGKSRDLDRPLEERIKGRERRLRNEKEVLERRQPGRVTKVCMTSSTLHSFPFSVKPKTRL